MIPTKTKLENVPFELSDELFLAEFAPQSNITEILSTNATGETTSHKGIVIHRLIDVTHRTAVRQNPQTLHTDLSPLIGKQKVVLAVAHPPYENISVYHWKLLLLDDIVEKDTPIQIKAARVASEEETKMLNGYFPKWLKLVENFDKREYMPVESYLKH